MNTTEDDLRAALRSQVPDDLDPSAFRARLDALIADPAPAVEGPSVELDTTPLDLTEQWQRRRPFAAWALTAAACVAAVVGIAIAVLPGEDHAPRPAAPPRVPADIRTSFLPGTIVLGTFTGSGNRTLAVPRRTVPENFALGAFAMCAGGGDLDLSGGVFVDTCGTPGRVVGTNLGGSNGPVKVRVDRGTTWTVVLVLAPTLRTNSDSQATEGAELRGPDNPLRRSGTGTSTVRFGGGSDPTIVASKYRLELVCQGTGVSLPDLRTPKVKGLRTRTCFDLQYVWNDVALTLPASVRVVAEPGTTWKILILPT